MSKTIEKHETPADFPEVKAAEAKQAEMLKILRAREAELHEAALLYPSGTAAEAQRLYSGNVNSPDTAELQHQVDVAKGAYEIAKTATRQAMIRACEKIVSENQDEHKSLVSRVRFAVSELCDSLKEENDFCQRFYAMGISQLSFNRPFLEIHRNLLNEFLLVSPDEFRPLT